MITQLQFTEKHFHVIFLYLTMLPKLQYQANGPYFPVAKKQIHLLHFRIFLVVDFLPQSFHGWRAKLADAENKAREVLGRLRFCGVF